MDITKERKTGIDVSIAIDVLAWWECENCGHKEKTSETIHISDYKTGESELIWCLESEKQRAEDCPKCGETMVIVNIKDDAFIDLTPFQEVE